VKGTRLRKVNWLAQDHTASKEWNWDPTPMLFKVIFPFFA
jgi:hypothetical protein